MQDLDEAAKWYFESMPIPTFAITMAAEELYEALAGHSLVHVVDVGSILGQYMPGLMRRLAAQPCGCPQVSGAAPPASMHAWRCFYGALRVPWQCACARGVRVYMPAWLCAAHPWTGL